MSTLGSSQKAFLRELLGNRVSFDRMERKLYGHDIAEMPSLVRPLVGDTVPEGVVQPESEEELVRLVRWARENRSAPPTEKRAASPHATRPSPSRTQASAPVSGSSASSDGREVAGRGTVRTVCDVGAGTTWAVDMVRQAYADRRDPAARSTALRR